MVFKRKRGGFNRRPRRKFGRRTFRRTKRRFSRPTVARVARQVRRHDKYFERKQIFPDATPGYIATTGSSYASFYVPVLGTSRFGRIGNTIFVKNIVVRGYFTCDQGEQSFVRAIPYMFYAPRAAGIIAPTDMLEDISTGTEACFSAFNPNTKKRRHIYFDKCWYMAGQDAADVTLATHHPSIKRFKWTFKINKQVRFNDTNGGTLVDIETNNLVILFFASETEVIQLGRMKASVTYIDA